MLATLLLSSSVSVLLDNVLSWSEPSSGLFSQSAIELYHRLAEVDLMKAQTGSKPGQNVVKKYRNARRKRKSS